ncbi:hypothetical protein HK101_006555 [Irineochytrium annulatum]|nr:hypothetical protein HK101_006555 [Irineochytrium annulatum]
MADAEEQTATATGDPPELIKTPFRKSYRRFKVDEDASLYPPDVLAMIMDGFDTRRQAHHFPDRRNNEPFDKSFNTGNWSDRERSHLGAAVMKYAARQGIREVDDVREFVSTKKLGRGKMEFVRWLSANARVNRSLSQISSFILKNFAPERENMDTAWTAEEEQELLVLLKSDKTWSEIDKAMGRVKCEAYTTRAISRQTSESTGPWLKSEVVQLIKSFTLGFPDGNCDVKHARKAWDFIGGDIGRSGLQCAKKAKEDGHVHRWLYERVRSPAAPLEAIMEIQWTNAHNRHLLLELLPLVESNGWQDLTDVDVSKSRLAVMWGKPFLKQRLAWMGKQVPGPLLTLQDYMETLLTLRYKEFKAKTFVLNKKEPRGRKLVNLL